MADNFRGVLIFVIFVVDLAVTKFSHPQKLMPTVTCMQVHDDGRGQKHTLWQRGQHFPVLASNSSHCHPADSVFDTNILLSHAFYSSLCRELWLSLVTKKIASACIDCIIACAAVPRPYIDCCDEI